MKYKLQYLSYCIVRLAFVESTHMMLEYDSSYFITINMLDLLHGLKEFYVEDVAVKVCFTNFHNIVVPSIFL